MTDNIQIDVQTTVQNVDVNVTPVSAASFGIEYFYPQGPAGSSLWGTISGVLSAQTDLWRYLSAVGTSNFDIATLNNYLSTTPILLSSLNVNGVMLSAGVNLLDIFAYSNIYQNLTGNWNNAYNTATVYQANSSSYATTSYVGANFLPLSGGIITGPTRINNNLTVFGNLTATGTTTFANTVFSVTSSLSVVHIGSGPAMWVGNSGDGDIASFYDIDQDIEILHVGGNNGTFPNVGVKTSTPNKDLTVKGEISASGTIYDNIGNSNQWNQAYSTVQTNSASWEESADILPTVTNYLSTNNVLLSSATVSNTLSINSVQIRTRGTSNLFIGNSTTGRDAATGNHNFVFGLSAGNALTSGLNNVFIGSCAGRVTTSGINNNFFGTRAGCNNTTGRNNNFFGCDAGRNNLTGGSNNFIGPNAGCTNTTGCGNNFFGLRAGGNNTTGYDNNFLGQNAGVNNTIGNRNNFLGSSTGYSNTEGINNNFFGSFVGEYNTTGSTNNFIGYGSGTFNTTGNNNNSLGSAAGRNNTTGNNNNFIGLNAGISNTVGSNNTIIGNEANVSADNLNGVIVLGTGAIATQTNQIVLSTANISIRSLSGIVAGPNLFIGNSTTGRNAATGNHNFVFGLSAGNALTTGANNVFLGQGSGKCIRYGSNNTFIGYKAGQSSSYSGNYNVFNVSDNFVAGFKAGYKLKSGSSGSVTSNNVFIGYKAGYNSENTSNYVSVVNNNFLGYRAGFSNTTGSSNNFLGNITGSYNTTGSSNNFLGYRAGAFSTTGSNNNFFGRQAGGGRYSIRNTGNNNNFFGQYAGVGIANGCNNNFFGCRAGGGRCGYYISPNYGCHNNFFGSEAGRYAGFRGGSHNTFIGFKAGSQQYYSTYNIPSQDRTNSYNFAAGFMAGHKLGAVSKQSPPYTTYATRYNVFLGHKSGYNSTAVGGYPYSFAATRNIFIGLSAGVTNSSGCDNTIIGNAANVASGNLNGVIAIGTGAIATESHQVVLSSANVIFRNIDNTFQIGSSAVPNNLTVFGSVFATTTRTIEVFTAADNQPTATAFATLDTRNSIAVLDFIDTSTESAVFVGIMPQSANLSSGVIVRLVFMATTATAGNVRWSVALERGNTDLDIDSFDAAAAANVAVNGTSGIASVAEITVTTIDGIVAGDLYRLRVQRIGGDAADTASGDAELIAVEVRSAA